MNNDVISIDLMIAKTMGIAERNRVRCEDSIIERTRIDFRKLSVRSKRNQNSKHKVSLVRALEDIENYYHSIGSVQNMLQKFMSTKVEKAKS
jgi:hypothetical protein